eukprot:2314487-Rhodomonas_salina.1
MWGSIWEGSGANDTTLTERFRESSAMFLERHCNENQIADVHGKSVLAWMLACMEPVDPTMADE